MAAGNATNPRAQVITAAGEGSAVAIAINTELVGALMIWLCVFSTLTVINVTLAGWLAPMPPDGTGGREDVGVGSSVPSAGERASASFAGAPGTPPSAAASPCVPSSA
jgi:hypothetical protein